MGYRNYISRIEKQYYNVIKLMDSDYREEHTEDIHEVGKETELTDKLIYIDKTCNGNEQEYAIISLESLPIIADEYAKTHLKFLKRVREGKNKIFTTAEKFLDDCINRWESPHLIFDIDKESKNIVSSWEYQYEIFEYLHIYKTFDLEKYYLIWSGR